MDNNFDKRLYLDGTTKHKVIIDTDPGVDDAACLLYAFFDEYIDIKLLTTVVGNISLEKATRNLLHLLDVFDVDIPVAKGAIKAMERESINAEFIHQKEGLGGYTPKNSNRKVLEENAIDAMYRVISDGDGDIIPIILGPQTNIGLLIKNHPDVINKIPKIVFMGGSPFGHPDYPDHVSFNISSDPEALGFAHFSPADEQVKILKVDGIFPTSSNIMNGRYPLARRYVLVVVKKSQDAEKFVDFLKKDIKNRVRNDMWLLPEESSLRHSIDKNTNFKKEK